MTNQSRLQLSLFIIATLPPLNETNVVTFLKNKVILRMFQIILTLGVLKTKITALLEKMQEVVNKGASWAEDVTIVTFHVT